MKNTFHSTRRPSTIRHSRDHHQDFLLVFLMMASMFTGPLCAEGTPPSDLSPRLVVQSGHADDVEALAFSPSAPLLASSDGETVLVWNFVQGKELRSFRPPHSSPISDVRLAFSPDGRLLAISSSSISEGHILIQDLQTGRNFSWPAQDHVNALAFVGPKGRLFSAGFDGIREWSIEDGTCINHFNTASVMAMASSSDGRLLASGGFNGEVTLWDLVSGKATWTRAAHKGPVNTVAFHPEGKSFASGGRDSTFLIWTLDGGAPGSRKSHAGDVKSIVYSPDGKRLITASSDWTIKIWTAESALLLETLDQPAWTLAVSSDSQTLAIGEAGRHAILLRDLYKGGESRVLGGMLDQVSSVAFRPDGSSLAVGSSDTRIHLWDLASGRPPLQLGRDRGSVGAVAYHPDGHLLATASYGGTIELLNAETGDYVRSWKSKSDCPVEALAFSMDGRTLVFGGHPEPSHSYQECSLEAWDFAEEPRQLAKRKGGYKYISLSPDGRRVAAVSTYVEILKTENGELLWKQSQGFVNQVAFGPDGRTLAMAGYGDLSLWEIDAKTHVPGESPRWTKQGLWTAVTISPDGRWLVASENAVVRIFDLAGHEIQELQGHRGLVTSIAFDPESRRIATGSWDGTVRLWDRRILGDATRWDALCILLSYRNRYFFLPESTWIVASPMGYFDTNSPDTMTGLHWVLSENSTEALPIERFMQIFYQPRLLVRLLRGSLPPSQRLVELNQEAPKVKIKEVKQTDAFHFDVVVEAAGVIGEVEHKGVKVNEPGGVYDLSLFVDGKLVQSRPSFDERARCSPIDLRDEEDFWRCLNRLTDGDTPKEIAFKGVRLPQRHIGAGVEISAYAYNRDRVKSETDFSRLRPDPFSFQDGEVEPRRAYLVTIGVSTHKEPGPGNLPMAAADARLLAREIHHALSDDSRPDFDKFADVVSVVLVSDTVINPQGEALPTKENIHTVIDLLAGRKVAEAARNALPPEVRYRLRASSADDLVLITFAGHGRTDSRGKFYILPYDAGSLAGQEGGKFCSHCIFTDELAEWLRDVQAHTLALILDSCESAASVETEEFRPGPMGDTGLGQLAHDKEMFILAASQPRQEAHGLARYGHSLLTEALVKEGLIDRFPVDRSGDMKLLDWLSFAVKRVPDLDQSKGTQVPALFDFTKKIPGELGDAFDQINILSTRLPESALSLPPKESQPEIPLLQPVSSFKLDRPPGRSISSCRPYLSANSRTVAVACEDNSHVWIFDTADGRMAIPSVTLANPEFDYFRLALSPNGGLLAMPGKDSVVLWDIQHGTSQTVSLEGPPEEVRFADGGRSLIVDLFFRPTRIYSLRTKRRLRLFRHLNKPVILSPDSKTLCASAEDGKPNLWDLRSGRVRDLPGTSRCQAFSPDGSLLALTDKEDFFTVRVIETGSTRTLGRHRVQFSLANQDFPLLFLPKSGSAIVRDDGGVVRHWMFAGDRFSPPFREEGGQVTAPLLLAVSGSGQSIALQYPGVNSQVKLWNPDRKLKATVFVPDYWSLKASPGGGFFAASLIRENAIRLWSLETGSLLGECQNAGADFVISAAGDVFVTANSKTSEVRLYLVPKAASVD